jgi:hypothetical protein
MAVVKESVLICLGIYPDLVLGQNRVNQQNDAADIRLI